MHQLPRGLRVLVQDESPPRVVCRIRVCRKNVSLAPRMFVSQTLVQERRRSWATREENLQRLLTSQRSLRSRKPAVRSPLRADHFCLPL
jgi:hypothetical protein